MTGMGVASIGQWLAGVAVAVWSVLWITYRLGARPSRVWVRRVGDVLAWAVFGSVALLALFGLVRFGLSK